MMNKKKIILTSLILIIIFIVGFYKNKYSENKKHHESQMFMGTVVSIDVCTAKINKENLKNAYKDAWETMTDIAFRMSVFEEKSEISRINDSKAMPVMVSADTYQLISDSIKYNLLTNGAFDVTVRPIILLWKKAQKSQEIPTKEEIDALMDFIGPEHVQLLSDNRVLVKNGFTQIDLGGIAKGYVIDQGAAALRRNGIQNFIIDAGGDVYVGGTNCENMKWKVGIRNPKKMNEVIEIIELTDAAVTTSGDYEQYFEINGKKWSHIINPLTGYPLIEGEGVSATVIAPNATEADALSTALCVLDQIKGKKLIDGLGEKYAGLTVSSRKGKINKVYSKEFKRHLK